jgi:hypothetical protein
MVPDHVRQEITQPAQRAELDRALESGALKLASITDPGDIGSPEEHLVGTRKRTWKAGAKSRCICSCSCGSDPRDPVGGGIRRAVQTCER